MPRVVHFEIQCDDADRAVKFFQQVFGWEFEKWSGPMEYWLVKTGESSQPGIDGGLQKREDPPGTVCNIIDVPDIDEYVQRVADAGGTTITPKQAIPGVGWFAYFKDTEGNVHGMMQSDRDAE